jgi:hypothetical protein
MKHHVLELTNFNWGQTSNKNWQKHLECELIPELNIKRLQWETNYELNTTAVAQSRKL